jgi:hypothetical protein
MVFISRVQAMPSIGTGTLLKGKMQSSQRKNGKGPIMWLVTRKEARRFVI